MVRNYVRTTGSRTYANYTEDTLKKAIQEVKRGKSITSTAKKYKIPVGTLFNKSKSLHPKAFGGQKRLSGDCERHVVSTITTLAEWLVPIGCLEIRLLIKTYLDNRGLVDEVFKDNMPGKEWLCTFMKRHNLTKRIADNVTRARAMISPESVNSYFDHLHQELDGLPPTHIFNYDETNLTDDPGSKTVIVQRGLRRVERIVDHSKSSTSVMFCGSADGAYLPPMVVYKCGTGNLYEGWTDAGPINAEYASTKTGWFDKGAFTKWFFNIFLPYASNLVGPVALIGDNLGSHFSPEVITATLEHDIKFITLLPSSTHVCQPLDVAVFRTLKSNWRKILDNWRKVSRYCGCIPKEQIPNLLAQLCDTLEPNHLKSGFKASGIYPQDRSQVLKRLRGFNKDPGGEDTRNTLNDCVLTFLQDQCESSGTSKPVRKGRGRKLTHGKRIVKLEASEKEQSQKKVKASSGKRKVQPARLNAKADVWQCGDCGLPWDEDGDDVWIQCDNCDQWYHLQCSGVDYDVAKYYELDADDINFICAACT